MAWASSGGYPGVVSGGYGVLEVLQELVAHSIELSATGWIEMPALSGPDSLFLGNGQLNDGMRLGKGIGLFNHTPPAAATVGGAHTAGGTYTAVEQAMLEAAYTALQSIGLVT